MNCENCGGYCDCMIDGGEFRPSKPKSLEDLIANLARRVTSLERKLSELEEQVDSNTKDIRTIGEELASISTEIEVTPKLQRKVVYEYDGYYAD